MPKGIYTHAIRSIAERYWDKVTQGPECWGWKASTFKAGYGQLSAGKAGEQPLYAHRVSWEIHNGPVPRGMFVCHTCDNPPCTNPAHLFLGTQADNMADCAAKGRAGSPPRPGEANHRAKLNAAQVTEIRRSKDAPQAIAAKYGITKSYVGNLKRGVKWAHTFKGDQA